MKKTTLKLYLLVFCLFTTGYIVNAQNLTYEVPLDAQVQASTQIIEGKVISKKSFWDANRENIYTVNQVEVYKVFKGQQLTAIDVITPGGAVGLDAQIVTPGLRLDVHDVGVFTLKNNAVTVPTEHTAFQVFSDTQGFYKYNVFNDRVINPYQLVEGITNFYDDIRSLTGTDYINVKDFSISSTGNRGGGLSISSISPTTATAGTFTELTINGSGFGVTAQNVGFANADDGGFTFSLALQTQIVSWSDTQIVVMIPDQAGTGSVAIIDSGVTTVLGTSAQTLNIDYAQINVVSDAVSAGTDVAYNTQHINDNISGGYTWRMFTDFDANTAANESFVRAMDTWRCTTDIYWTIGGVTTTDVNANDGINIIRFDNGAELPSGVLGLCVSRFSGCFAGGGTTIDWFVNELDIIFDDGINWQFGLALPSFSQYDFESVAVHELGHGHQMAHVIDTSEIMHYALSNGDYLRVLSTGDINGANDVHSRSTSIAVCGQPLMLDFDCSLLSVADEDLNAAISIYPNPSSGLVFINNTGRVNLETADIYDINGRLVLQKQLSNATLNQIDLSNVSKGVYFLTINSDDASITEKIIIE